MGSWMLDMVDHEQELMGVQCVLDHLIQDLKPILEWAAKHKEALGVCDDYVFDTYTLIDIVDNFKSKYKKDLGL